MTAYQPIPAALLEVLRRTPTADVADALALLRLRLPNEGYAGPNLRRLTEARGPLVGHAVTLSVRTADPAMDGRRYFDRPDWWRHLLDVPPPRVVVIEDRDRGQGSGAFLGGAHAAALRAVGCAGVITDGLARRLHDIEALGFQVFAVGRCPSHAFAHIVETGGRVLVEGLSAEPGDWVHADSDGILVIPREAADTLASTIHDAQTGNAKTRAFCAQPGLTPEGLAEFLRSLPSPRNP